MKLKPVTFPNTRFYSKYERDNTRQIMLLNALKFTQDPKKLKDIIGVKKVADVFRTLDKMALRKEYHKALHKNGIDFDFVLKGIKDICVTAGKHSDRIKAYQVLLKSMGMEKYEESSEGGGSWEDALQKLSTSKGGEKTVSGEVTAYEVKAPMIPESVKAARKEEEELGRDLYK